MNVGSLFSGIGGLDEGFRREGFTIPWCVEWNPYCREVLKRHFPEATIYGDIRSIDWTTVTPVDVLIGGFPCQPHSVAGKKKGSRDERDLWPDFNNAIRSLRPAWVVAENVPGLLSSDHGRFFKGILSDLASEGYDAEWFTLSAAEVGAPHKRERIFIIAYTASQRGGRRTQKKSGKTQDASKVQGRDCKDRAFITNSNGIGTCSEQHFNKRSEDQVGKLEKNDKERAEQHGTGALDAIISFSKSSNDVGNGTHQETDGQHEPNAIADTDALGRQDLGRNNREVFITNDWNQRIQRFKLESIQGIKGFSRFQNVRSPEELFNRSDLPQPLIRRDSDGLPRRLDSYLQKERTQAIGNAVVPQVAQFIARRLKEIADQDVR